MVRGLRALADFEYEFQLAHMNRRLGPGIDTVFLMTSEKDFYVTSSLVKEVAQFGGDVTGLVPPVVEQALVRTLGEENMKIASRVTKIAAVAHARRQRQGRQAARRRASTSSPSASVSPTSTRPSTSRTPPSPR